jgi:hypothetical protein
VSSPEAAVSGALGVARRLLFSRRVTRRRALSALLAALVLVACTESARAQAADDESQTPIVEPLPTTALPAAPPPAEPPPAVAPAEPQMIHQPYLWLAGPGGFVFLVSYGAALLAGTFTLLTPGPSSNSVSNDLACDSTCKKQGALVLLPVVGPLLSFQTGPHNPSDTKIGLWWSGIEAVGLTMMVVGLVGHDVPQTPFPAASPTPGKVSVVPFVAPGAGALSLRMAF